MTGTLKEGRLPVTRERPMQWPLLLVRQEQPIFCTARVMCEKMIWQRSSLIICKLSNSPTNFCPVCVKTRRENEAITMHKNGFLCQPVVCVDKICGLVTATDDRKGLSCQSGRVVSFHLFFSKQMFQTSNNIPFILGNDKRGLLLQHTMGVFHAATFSPSLQQ